MATRTNLVTVIRTAVDGGVLAVVVSVNPFGDKPSVHLQRYRLSASGRTSLISDSPYRTEAAAVAAFDRIHTNNDER